jgi:phenylpropionate dioxygenase-like ring-hydroxylating dioxygenase large terminal subunit
MPDAPPTLPLSWYFDPGVLAIERETILAGGPRYAGATPMVPRHGSFHSLAQRRHGEVLVRDGDDIRLLSNVCLHRNHLLSRGGGTAKALVCPMHRWAYDLTGNLINAPLFDGGVCGRLPSRPLQQWNGLLFDGPRDIAADLAILGDRPDLDVSSYVLDEVQEIEYDINWKIPIEIGLENYHAPFLHPGYARYTTPQTWFENDGAFDRGLLSYHQMRPHPEFGRNPASRAFEEMERAILRINGGPPRFGVVILIYLPNTFFEWWPYAFESTTYTPLSPGRTLMTREIFFDPKACAAVPEYPQLWKAAWFETQKADDDAQVAMQRGRAARHRVEPDAPCGYGVYQAMEDSTPLFVAMIHEAVAPRLSAADWENKG